MKTRTHCGSRIGLSLAMYAALILAFVLLSARLAQSQALTQSLGELQNKVRIGDKIQVIDDTGRKTEGKFDGSSAASLRLIADGSRQEFLEARIREVRKRRPESRWDGVLMGLGIGAVAGVVNVKAVCGSASERDDCYTVGWAIVLPLFAGGGAGAGALIDFAIRKHDVVFAPEVRTSYRLRLSPILNTRRKGVALSVSF